MPVGRIVVAIALLGLFAVPTDVFAQYQAPSQFLSVTAQHASTWNDGSTGVVQLQGPVTIQTDRAKMTADRAVLWLTPLPGTVLDQQRAEIALLGNVHLVQAEIERSGDSLFVITQVQGAIRLNAGQRLPQNLSDSDLYRDAQAMRPLNNLTTASQTLKNQWITQRPWMMLPPPPPPTSAPSTQEVRPKQRVWVKLGKQLETFTLQDGKIAALLTGGVSIVEVRPNGDVIQLEADSMVLFTPLTSLTALAAGGNDLSQIEDAVTSAYLEGDVRIVMTPRQTKMSEQRLRAQRVYYDFATDRAVLTEAIIHLVEPQRQIPIVIRANEVRQLSMGEYKAEKVELTSSSFAEPSYSIYSDRAYVREYDTGDPRLGNRTVFTGSDNLFKFQNVPLFYWPWAGGSLTEEGMALQGILIGSSRGFGPGIRTKWGLFETLGQPHPQDLDVKYNLDYFVERGPAGGLDADYKGGFVTETGKQPWNFKGDFTSYFVWDHGEDKLGAERRRVEPEEDFRYHVLWEHQHFFPNDWQLQLRAGLVSDPTFLEEWFRSDFNDGLPHDISAYLKRQRQTEALTFGFNFQPNDFVTTADNSQEQVEVEHLPELGYYRIGDSIGPDDRFTFFSANTIDGLHYKQSDASLAELGFRPNQSPGLASLGNTGLTDDTTYRGDFRQEIDYPISAGQFRMVPYIMGRYTAYSDSPGQSAPGSPFVKDGGNENRVFLGTGLRLTTAFWRVDDTASSDLFDIHRIRHVIEPELHLFTSFSTTDRDELFNYDEPVDSINDITAAQIAIHQRWQTKRGGPGQWRSVDFFSLNLEANFFANQPDSTQIDPITGFPQSTPNGFRGLFFPSEPEFSIPRNSINADALWRMSDSTALFYDVQYNLDELTLATTSIGLAAQRDTRLSYFLGLRYIGEINSTIASLSTTYQLSSKYIVGLTQTFNLSERRNEDISLTLIRRFDRYYLTFTVFHDEVSDDSGFRVGIYPEGLGFGLSSAQLQQAMVNQP